MFANSDIYLWLNDVVEKQRAMTVIDEMKDLERDLAETQEQMANQLSTQVRCLAFYLLPRLCLATDRSYFTV